MDDLVLRTRLTILKRNLRQVAEMLKDAEDRKQEISVLRTHLLKKGGIRYRVVDAQDELRHAQASLQSAAQRLGHPEVVSLNNPDVVHAAQTISGVQSSFSKVLIDLNQVIKMIVNCHDEFEKIGKRLVKLDGNDIKNNLNRRLAQEATLRIDKVDEILERLRSVGPNGDATLKKAWNDYKKVLDPSEPLFVEYVDFLRGLALRETGLDLGICQIADDLLGKLDKAVDWKSLTIPARHEKMGTTVAQIIRLGFPEWTIWAVPLAVHELGHIVAKHSDAKKHLKEYVLGKKNKFVSNQENCLADAFATYTMGPAYACAALLLRFDPQQSKKKIEHQAERAYVILEMLDRMSPSSRAVGSFKEIRERLLQAWSAALGQAAASGLATDRPKLEDWVDGFQKFLDKTAYLVAYRNRSWVDAEACADQLLTTGGAGDPACKTDDLRDVLNAAWRCRLDHPDKAENIRVAAMGLWESLLSQPGPQTGPATSFESPKKGLP